MRTENGLREQAIRTKRPLVPQRSLRSVRDADVQLSLAVTAKPKKSVSTAMEMIPIEALGLSPRVESALKCARIRRVGQILVRGEELIKVRNVGVKAAEEIRQAIASLEPLVKKLQQPDEQSGESTKPPAIHADVTARLRKFPPAPVVIQEALDRATTVSNEVEALLFGINDRNAGILQERWTSRRGRQPTLETIAGPRGVTRERIRQIVARREEMLRSSRLVLPVTSTLVRLLNDNGGVLTTARYLRLARRAGHPIDEHDLGVVACLSELGLADDVIMYNRDYDVWVSAQGEARWLASGDLQSAFRKTRKEVVRQLRRTSAFPVALLRGSAPLGSRRLLRSLRSRGVRVSRVHGYFVADITTDSNLHRTALKALVVAQSLSLAQLSHALRGAKRLDLPPLNVLKAILERSPDLNVDDEIVSLAKPLTLTEALSPAEAACVRALESAGGVMLWHEIVDAVVLAGFSVAMAAVVLHAPFMSRRGIALYTLRGREIDKALVRQKLREREESQTEAVRRVREISPDVVEVQYVITRFSQHGTLRMAPRLRRSGIPRWTLRLPDGHTRELKYANGFIWNFAPWFRDARLTVGDVITTAFYLGTATVEITDFTTKGDE
jgi:hypothetical protein